MKRLVTIQDISCIGKCSLTVALPIISAAGIETAVIPTALLSNHTAFDRFSFLDLTDEIENITDNWRRNSFSFDAIYTGYLGSGWQLEMVSKFISEFGKGRTLTVIDPVMGDHGKLYQGFTMEFAKKMKGLCRSADILVPNLTEAAILTETPYKEDFTEAEIRNMLKKLSSLTSGTIVLTGISPNMEKIGVMSYNPDNDEFSSYFTEKINRVFHGTGDIFASALCGALVRGISIEASIKIAVDYTTKCIKYTLADENPIWYGVNFEEAIPYYIKLLSERG